MSRFLRYRNRRGDVLSVVEYTHRDHVECMDGSTYRYDALRELVSTDGDPVIPLSEDLSRVQVHHCNGSTSVWDRF